MNTEDCFIPDEEETDSPSFIVVTLAYLGASWKNRPAEEVDKEIQRLCERIEDWNETLLSSLRTFRDSLSEEQKIEFNKILTKSWVGEE